MKLKPIRNHVIFQFVDEVDGKGQFVQKTNWGLTIASHYDNSAKAPRWVKVAKVGPECEHVKPGKFALVNALMWSFPFKINDEKFWRTDETKIVATKNTMKGQLHALHNTVIFERLDKPVDKMPSGLFVVGNTNVSTPSGKVVQVGPDAEQALNGAIIYFDDKLLFNQFEHDNNRLWYIEEPSVFAYQLAEEPVEQ